MLWAAASFCVRGLAFALAHGFWLVSAHDGAAAEQMSQSPERGRRALLAEPRRHQWPSRGGCGHANPRGRDLRRATIGIPAYVPAMRAARLPHRCLPQPQVTHPPSKASPFQVLTIRLPLHRRISAGSLPGGDSRIHFHSFKGCLSLPKLNISAGAGTMVLASGSSA